MGGGGGTETSTEEEDPLAFASSLSLYSNNNERNSSSSFSSSGGGVKKSLCDAPILFLVLSHKAFAVELSQLHRLVEEEAAAEGGSREKVLVELGRRFEFLRVVYKYHCVAEDEVIFLALDERVKNIVSTYSLEHKFIEENFSSIFNCLHNLREENSEDVANKFQQLVCSVGLLQTSICEHMFKEEKQVFPLLMQKFSSEEQAKLVWKYICSVPIKLLQDFLPWVTSLSAVDRLELVDSLKFVVPKESLLQEVVISWIDNEKGNLSRVHNVYGRRGECYELYSPEVHLGEETSVREAFSTEKWGGGNPVDGIHIWQRAIVKDLEDILKGLYRIKSSLDIPTLSSSIIQLKFFLEILVFYSNALDVVFYPLINEPPLNDLLPPHEPFVSEIQIEGLQRLLYGEFQDGMKSSNFLPMLCGEVELFIMRVSKSLSFLEKEVFPLISQNCSTEIQLSLLYSTLQMMPLGLLKHMVLWFSAHLTDEGSKIILNRIRRNHCVDSNPFLSLLQEWIRMGYSGKASVETFREELQDMFKSRSCLMLEDAEERTELSDKLSGMAEPNNCNPVSFEPNLPDGETNSSSTPSSSNYTEKYDVSYSSEMSLNVLFPEIIQKASTLQYRPGNCSIDNTFVDLESRPMDYILLFHKVLIKDLECLVRLSYKLLEDDGLLPDFQRLFHLLQFFYQLHSESEDEVAFPALESKSKLHNISHSYAIDHKLEMEQFRKVQHILNDITLLKGDRDTIGQRKPVYQLSCLKLLDACISMHKMLSNHIYREEIELWPLFQSFSVKEQEKIVAHILGRTQAEVLQKMIPWLIASITPEEQHAMISLWLKTTKHTKFSEWMGEWWEGMRQYVKAKKDEKRDVSSSLAVDPLEVVSSYLFKGASIQEMWNKTSHVENSENPIKQPRSDPCPDQAHLSGRGEKPNQPQQLSKFSEAVGKRNCDKALNSSEEAEEARKLNEACHSLTPQGHTLLVDQEELETAIRRVSADLTLDPQKKPFIIQNLLMSRWIVTQQKSHLGDEGEDDGEKIPGQCPSYRDPPRSDFGCKHYKRNCKLLMPCCNKLYTCIRCHDEMTDHSVDRKLITKMMCMKCLAVQPLHPKCLTPTCNNFSMAKYICKICKLFDDERNIYHCPYCNLCRVGKGLGIDYFHCMNCNACMNRSLSVHVCREKCFEDNCPICHEYIFTSSSPVKALPCGHLMHSSCFQDYTYTHYTCPICSKSLGDMQVYFQMLDALLAEEKIPEEYSEQTQVILCNDCEKKGNARFHWLHHKCPYCGSYNTRLL